MGWRASRTSPAVENSFKARFCLRLAYVVTKAFVQMESLHQPSRRCVSLLSGRRDVCAVFLDSSSDPVGAGMLELLENCQCASPGGPRGLRIAKGLVGVAKRHKSVGFLVTVAELMVQVDGLLTAGYGFPLVAEMTMSVA